MTVRLAHLTAPGRSALATIALHGPEAEVWSLVQPLFRTIRGNALEQMPPLGRVRYGKMEDEVVLARVPQGFEIHCHGGPEVVRLLTERFTQAGAEAVAWPDWIADDALRLLPHAPTLRTAGILLDQHHGAFRSAISQVLAALPDTTALRILVDRIPIGRHLLTPWRIAVAGAPNAGKSSLINAIAGFQRTLVSPIPGTTRDLVRVPLALEGWPLEWIDTAGLREQAGVLEAEGIALARHELDHADLVVWVMDATSPEPLPPDRPALVVINKIDAAPAGEVTTVPGAIAVSARTGAGLTELLAVVVAALVPTPPQPGDAVPYTEAQFAALLRASAAAEAGKQEQVRRELLPHAEH
jgi:tRNA modification GTPase